MGRPRAELSAKLHTLCDNVYFQPPNGKQMVYPCIVYNLDGYTVKFANGKKYLATKKYIVTVIDRDPDSSLSESVHNIPGTKFDARLVSDNLYHDIYKLSF